MVKGVTRRIVEIKETGSSYFERAIFFVSMEGRRGVSEYTLSQEARRIVDRFSGDKALTSPDVKPKKRDVALSVLKLIASAAFGAFLTLLFTEIL
jgi:hypothetical protein